MRAIRRNKKHEDLVRRLTEPAHPDSNKSIFPTMRELMCFAALLGFENEKQGPLVEPSLEIDGRIFVNHQQSLDVLYLLALTTEKDANVLREDNEDQMVKFFEEYAEGGLEIIEQWMREMPEDPTGERAIINGLQERGYLSSQTKDTEVDPGSVSF